MLEVNGDPGRIRTCDLMIRSLLVRIDIITYFCTKHLKTSENSKIKSMGLHENYRVKKGQVFLWMLFHMQSLCGFLGMSVIAVFLT